MHADYCAVVPDKTACLEVLIPILISLRLIGVSGIQPGNARLLKRQQLTIVDLAVAVLVLPEPQFRPVFIILIDNTVTVGIKLGKRLEAICRLGTIGECARTRLCRFQTNFSSNRVLWTCQG